MKFDQVLLKHITLALQDLKEKGLPIGFKASAYFDIEIDGELYPPKPIMAYANYHATGEEPTNNFSGGVDTPCFKAFERLGIPIIKKTDNMSSTDESKSLKKEFINWLIANPRVNYYNNDYDKLEQELDRYNNFFSIDIYNASNLKEVKKFLQKELYETVTSDFLEFSERTSRHLPRAVLGNKNYFEFLNTRQSTEKNNNNFTWVPTYKAIVQFLKDKQNDQVGLIDLLKDSGCDVFNDQNPEENIIELDEIDPFTFFCYLNKYYKQRLEILQKLSKTINAPLPKDDFGIPSANPQKVWMFPYKYMRNNNEIDRLWKFFHNALENTISDEQFEDVLQIRGVALTKITEALFYIAPETYFPINGPTKPYLEEVLGIDPIFKTFTDYKSILEQIKSKSDKPFYQLSYEAWQWNDNLDSDLRDFQKSIEKNSNQDLGFYFDYLEGLTRNLNLNEGDNRVVFSCKGNYLNFNIGQRVAWRLDPRKGRRYHIMTDQKINENSEPFDGGPDHFYHVFNERDELTQIKKSSFNASIMELSRTTKSGYKKHNNKYFEKAVYDKTFRNKFLNTEAMENEENTIDLNQIFFGPPGTGKTFHTINEAIKIVDPVFYEIHKDDRDQLKARFKLLTLNNHNESQGQIGFTTFHQSFSYEDFIEGIKPNKPKEGDAFLKYEIQEGVFKKICRLAEDSLNVNVLTPKNFVLIVDEINRGNVSSVFGELITLIEKDKRAGADEELSVTLPYSKETFSVPQNVYIIGTMNTADRSIEALDTALRRRFSFREMPPKPELIKTVCSLKSTKGKLGDIDVVKVLETINNRIEKLIDKDHKIGHSYFLNISSKQDLKDTFRDKVIPLLEEYFFGDFGKISLVLGSSFISKESKADVSFATSNDYDSSIANDLLERSVYEITSENNWDFKAIYE